MNSYTIALALLGLLTTCVRSRTDAYSSSNSSGKTVTYTVSGKVRQQFPYCGGARPTPEMIAKAATPVAYAGKTFYVRAGNTNTENGEVVQRFTTNNEGVYALTLPPGTYSIIVEEQLNPINPQNYMTNTSKVNKKCLIDWWKKPYFVLEVNRQDITSLDFTFVHRCFINSDIPCVTYTGPMPH